MNAAPRVLVVRWASLAYMRNVATLANFLSRSGMEVKVLSFEGESGDRRFLDEAVEWVSLGFSPRYGAGFRKKAAAARWLRAALERETFDALYVIDSWTLQVFWLAGLGSFRAHGKPWIYHTYDWLEPGVSPRLAIWLERAACRAAQLVVNTDRTRARLQRTLYGLRSTPVWIPNCLSRSEPIPPPQPEIRRAWFEDDPEGAVVLICPSVASRERLTLPLIEAYKFLPERHRLVTFVADDDYGRQCREQAGALGIAARVRLLSPVTYDEVLRMTASADLGAIFHDAESSSGYFMANADRLGLFAACGIPVVAADYPNLEAVVYRSELGVCCDPYSAREIANAILEVGDDPGELLRRKAAARAAFERTIHFEKEGGRLVAALSDVIEKWRHDGRASPMSH